MAGDGVEDEDRAAREEEGSDDPPAEVVAVEGVGRAREKAEARQEEKIGGPKQQRNLPMSQGPKNKRLTSNQNKALLLAMNVRTCLINLIKPWLRCHKIHSRCYMHVRFQPPRQPPLRLMPPPLKKKHAKRKQRARSLL